MDNMLKKINKQSWLLLGIAAVASLFFADVIFAFSILLSGALGILNFRGIVWGAKSLIGGDKAQLKMLVLSMFKLLVMFSILLILVIFKLINLFGVLIGFTIVFVVMVKEGLIAARNKENAAITDDSHSSSDE
ncbi:MAG: hypothetical protein LLF86_03205 [Nitrospiraceae bacterium]|nr:hypothetical protein [Nitrospiraceae bacterium]